MRKIFSDTFIRIPRTYNIYQPYSIRYVQIRTKNILPLVVQQQGKKRKKGIIIHISFSHPFIGPLSGTSKDCDRKDFIQMSQNSSFSIFLHDDRILSQVKAACHVKRAQSTRKLAAIPGFTFYNKPPYKKNLYGKKSIHTWIFLLIIFWKRQHASMCYDS